MSMNLAGYSSPWPGTYNGSNAYSLANTLGMGSGDGLQSPYTMAGMNAKRDDYTSQSAQSGLNYANSLSQGQYVDPLSPDSKRLDAYKVQQERSNSDYQYQQDKARADYQNQYKQNYLNQILGMFNQQNTAMGSTLAANQVNPNINQGSTQQLISQLQGLSNGPSGQQQQQQREAGQRGIDDSYLTSLRQLRSNTSQRNIAGGTAAAMQSDLLRNNLRSRMDLESTMQQNQSTQQQGILNLLNQTISGDTSRQQSAQGQNAQNNLNYAMNNINQILALAKQQ